MMFNYADDATGAWRGHGLAENCPEGCTPIEGAAARSIGDRWNGEAWQPDPAAATTRRCAEVDTLREAKFEAGIGYAGKILQLREMDQQRIIAAGAQAKFALLTGSAWPAGFGWIMADNSVLPVDAAQMSSMADAAAAQVSAWIFTAHAHKQAIRGLTEVAEIEAYDIESGW